jgi:hypothetical protein
MIQGSFPNFVIYKSGPLSKVFQIIYGYSKAFLFSFKLFTVRSFPEIFSRTRLNPAKDRIPIDNKV